MLWARQHWNKVQSHEFVCRWRGTTPTTPQLAFQTWRMCTSFLKNRPSSHSSNPQCQKQQAQSQRQRCPACTVWAGNYGSVGWSASQSQQRQDWRARHTPMAEGEAGPSAGEPWCWSQRERWFLEPGESASGGLGSCGGRRRTAALSCSVNWNITVSLSITEQTRLSKGYYKRRHQPTPLSSSGKWHKKWRRGHTHCKILRKYCIFRVPYAF